jgi:hypothetical protein
MYTGAIIGGRDANGEQYYIGRFKHGGCLWIGRVWIIMISCDAFVIIHLNTCQ